MTTTTTTKKKKTKRSVEGGPHAAAVPPSLAEDPDRLRAEATGPRPAPEHSAKPKKGKAEPVVVGTGYPIEAITAMHKHLWTIIAQGLKSRFVLPDKSAEEMARYADIVFRQYLGPEVTAHTAIGCYVYTQGMALIAVLSMREPARKDPPARATKVVDKPNDNPIRAGKGEGFGDPPGIGAVTGPR